MYIALTRIPIRVTVLNMNSSRPYSMAKRGEQAAATKQRIIDAARELISSETPDFTLALVAESAGTSVQTVLRAFGNKEGLIVEAVVGPLSAEYATPPPVPRPVPEAVRRVFDEFEENGDRLMWLVANEHRVDGLATVIAGGRAIHRERVTAVFADRLAGYRPRRSPASGGRAPRGHRCLRLEAASTRPRLRAQGRRSGHGAPHRRRVRR